MEKKLKHFNSNRNWKGRWIWDQDDGDIENSYYYFRREFTVEKEAENNLKNHKIYITADTRYQLYLNGEFIGEGPLQSQPYFKYYDIRELGSVLNQGQNCLAIIVNYTGTIPDTRGGLLVEIVNDSNQVLVKTDSSWKVKRASAWREDTFNTWYNQVTTHQEFFDAREVPSGWKQAGFDDSNWNQTQVLQGRYSDRPPAVTPWTNLRPRDIPYMEKKTVFPENILKVEEALDIANRWRSEDLSIVLSTTGNPLQYSTIKNEDNLLKKEGNTTIQNSTEHQDKVFDGIYDPCILLDFGRVITGYIEINLKGVDGGTVDIGYAERLIDGEFNNAIEGQFADRFIMKAGQQSFRSFTWKGFRYLKLRFHSCLEPVKINSVKSILTTYPYQEKGVFKADNEKLQDIFDISKYTLRLCSQEFIMDTPWREQGQWLGDVSAVTLGGIYSCFGEKKLPAKFLKQSGANQHPTGLLANITNTVSKSWQGVIPDYSLWWVKAIWNHYLYTGEEKWIHQYYPHITKIIHSFLQYLDEYGLVADMPYWPLIDWADLDRRGEFTALNALFYGTLADVKKMADLKQDQYQLDLIKEVRTGIKANFQKRLYNSELGAFADANIEGELSSQISEHGNSAAVLWDLPDQEVTSEIINNFYEKENIDYTEAQPYFTTVVLQALDEAGRFDLALEIIFNRWGKRMVDRGAQSTFEEWGINGSWRNGDFKGFLRSLSHAWSAHPAEFLIKNLIGLEILEPGCSLVALNPRPVDFDYEVVFPSPSGKVKVNKKEGKLDISTTGNIKIKKRF